MLILALLLAQQTITPAGTSARNAQAVQGVTGGVALHTVCDSGCGGAATFEDNDIFTADTTTVANMAGVFNDSITALTSGHAGAPRLTSKRAIHFNMRTDAGVEVPFPAALDADGGFKIHHQNLPPGAATETTLGDIDGIVAGLTLAQGSVTAGELGPLVQGAATTAAPTYLDAKTYPLSLTLGGRLRVDGTGGTFPISGSIGNTSFGATQGTSPWVVGFNGTAQPVTDSTHSNVTADYDTGAGTQTTTMWGIGFPASGGAVAWPGDSTNGGKVQIAAALPAGTAVIGHVIADTGSTTACTQATGTNLHAVLDTTSTTAVTQATAANLLGTMKLVDTAGTNLGSILGNDATAIGNGLETQPGVARASPTATTAGRSEKLQQSATNGGVFSVLVGGAGTLAVDGFANDATAVGNGLQVHPAVSKAGPAATTAGRSELEQIDSVSGGQYVTESPTTNNVALTQKTYTANTALSVKASAGNVYGWSAINAAAAVCWLQFYNTAGTPTCGTSVVWSVPLPVTPGVSNTIATIPYGNFATGIGICVSTTATGGTTCGSTSSGTIFYK